MAEGVLLDLLSKVLGSLGNSAVRNVVSWWGARDELKKLAESMRMIQARVRDAELRQEDVGSEAIKEWLRRLKLVLYRADDLFDEVSTVDRQKQQMEKTVLAKVGIIISKSGPLYYNRKLANEIKFIRKKLDAIKSDMEGLNLNVVVAEELQQPINRLMKKRETSSFVSTKDVIGRDVDKDEIVELLCDPKYDGDEITVIPIVGFGGLGKTTLAQLVFNDERVNNHFDLTKWAYVPEKNNQSVIMGKIFNSFTGKIHHNLPLEEIQQGIRDSIKDNKYLLVLDDLWDEAVDRLIDLVNLLKCGKQGSKVIVTTRSDVVAKGIGTIGKPHKLGTLTDGQSWSLFKRLAFKPGQEDKNPVLSKIGEEIVKMCGNVPLVIKVVGGSLRPKDTEKEWLQVRDAQRLKAQLTKGDDIMDVLKLSYYYLPPALKQCFAYCSLFPKGYELVKDVLVHLWMAQGYFESSNEDIGSHYFSELLARNLFQDPKVSGEGDVYGCKMHDLVHDLAQHVSGDACRMLGDESLIQNTDELVHVGLGGSTCPPSLVLATNMRSLVSMNDDVDPTELISRFQSLRVLRLNQTWNKKLQNSVGKLIHLRYLKLGADGIGYLPESITKLENLQTLNLEGCNNISELPSDLVKLTNLKHLLIHEKLTDLPSGFGRMTSLQELNIFIVGKNNGIDSLPALNLRGRLKVKFLKWRINAIPEVKRANLKDNDQLTSLTLDLAFDEKEDVRVVGEMNKFLSGLGLPLNLKFLGVEYYKGDEMPGTWLNRLSKLVTIRFFNFRNCKVLPQLSRLPHLKKIHLSLIRGLEYVEEEDNIAVGTAALMYFASLEILKINYCFELKGWTRPSKDDGEQCRFVFPSLLKIKVDYCPMLMSMPLAPKLELLDAESVDGKLFESNLTTINDHEELASSSRPPSSSALFTSLKHLKLKKVHNNLASLSFSSSLCNLNELEIHYCRKLRELKFETPNSIRKLSIEGCTSLRNISESLQHLSMLETLRLLDYGDKEEDSNKGWQNLSSLRQLELWDIPSLPQGIGCLTKLQKLSLNDVKNLTELPEEIGNLSLLRVLMIYHCRNLRSLPKSLQGIATLQALVVRGNPRLAKRYKKPDGEDCHVIQHIPYVLM